MNFFFALCLSAVAEDPDAQLQRSFEREFAYVQAEKRTLENQIKISHIELRVRKGNSLNKESALSRRLTS